MNFNRIAKITTPLFIALLTTFIAGCDQGAQIEFKPIYKATEPTPVGPPHFRAW